MKLTPFQRRIVTALLSLEPCMANESELGHKLYPDARSWRACSKGGPPGFQMGLSRSLLAMARAGLVTQRITGPGPGQREVWLTDQGKAAIR